MRAGALGDVLLLRRAVCALKRAGHGVHLLAPETPGRVLVGTGPSEVGGLTALDGPALAGLLSGDSDRVSPAPLSRADAILALSDSSDLIQCLRPFAPRFFSRSPHPEPGHHASVWLATPVRALGADPLKEPAPLVFTPEEKAAASEAAPSLPPGFVAVHPGSGSPDKNWPAKRFATFLKGRPSPSPWLLVLGPAEEEGVPSLLALPGATPVRHLPLRTLGALLSRAGLYLGNDTGITHLAAATGAPTLALFGPTDPATWSPLGPRVQVLRSEDETMASLEVSAVQRAAKHLSPRS